MELDNKNRLIKYITLKEKQVSYCKMVKKLSKSDIVFFGEKHNNAIAHWLEYEITVSLDKKKDLILGAEMIEADNQEALNKYLIDSITSKGLDTLARLWENYKTDYKPLVDYAKNNNLKFIATNIPRRFASKIYKNGFNYLDSLSDLQKSWVATLPIKFDSTIKAYVAIKELMGEHGTMELIKAQASKDATMAHFILKNYIEDKLFLHYNGSWHSDNNSGIVWYINLHKPKLKCGTITTVSQKDIHNLEEEHKGKADFIICVDENMTTTY